MKQSAGIFLLNRGTGQFLIVHPSGPYNRKAPWHIPKGELAAGTEADRESDLLENALRETLEETGLDLRKNSGASPRYLGKRKYRSGAKTVHAFFCQIDQSENPAVQLDWENDKYLWVEMEKLPEYLHESQIPFLEQIKELLR